MPFLQNPTADARHFRIYLVSVVKSGPEMLAFSTIDDNVVLRDFYNKVVNSGGFLFKIKVAVAYIFLKQLSAVSLVPKQRRRTLFSSRLISSIINGST